LHAGVPAVDDPGAMTTIYRDHQGDVATLRQQRVAVVGYGNQGRSWALNLRDSGCDIHVHVRDDTTRARAVADGFVIGEVAEASAAPVVCVLVPDDVIPTLPLRRLDDGLTIVASGYSLAFGGFTPAGDVGLIAPRMLGPEVRRCYVEGGGFITALGVHQDRTGHALERVLAVAKAIGGLRQGAIEMTPHQEAILDLAVEQALSPMLTHANGAFVAALLERDIPIEAILTELYLSGEVERNYRLLREVGFARQLDFHSPTSQYGQLSRRGTFDHLDVLSRMRELIDDVASGRFAAEWDAESRAGHPRLAELRALHAGPAAQAFEESVRRSLGLPQGAPSDLRERREAVVREHMASENRQDFAATLATFAHPRYEIVPTSQVFDGEEAVRRYYAASRAAFPDQRNELRALRHADDAVIAEFDLLGTHRGTFLGSPPTGREFRCPMVALFVFEDGGDRLVCERVYFDAATILHQLGIAAAS
jgi:ketol-acid reductoisomerase